MIINALKMPQADGTHTAYIKVEKRSKDDLKAGQASGEAPFRFKLMRSNHGSEVGSFGGNRCWHRFILCA
jgi:hypothetical protein